MLFKPPAFLSLSGVGLSFVFNAYEGEHCQGNAKEGINVYDNTCDSNPGFTWRSYIPVAYGGHRQRAGFYGGGSCDALAGPWTDTYADGGGDYFKQGQCVTLSFAANAAGSRSA
jgi:hypothetical protein